MDQLSRGNFIDGNWTAPDDPNDKWSTENPANTAETVFEFRWAASAVNDAVKAARNAQSDWHRRDRKGRLPFLKSFRDALQTRQDELARAITTEMGKPLWEARGEAGALLKKIDIMTGEGLDHVAAVRPEGLDRGGWDYRPLGVLAVLGPFNFPLHLPNGHIIPALATGNTVVVKPSEHTPLSMQLYFECLQEADFPEGVVNLVQGPGPVGARLSSHRRVDGVLFTGSYETGRKIREATLDQPHKLLALEMGGKNSSIVCADADLEQTARSITTAACLTTGQRCSATSRVVAHSSVVDELLDRLRELFERTTTGDPLDENDEPLMGPLATEANYSKFVAAQSDDENGALDVVLEGGDDGDRPNGYFVRPAIWRAREVDPGGSHQATELFGPDVVVYGVDGDDEAVRVSNATDYGLAMSVFTSDDERFERMAYDLETGVLNLNRSTCGASSRLPFGGVKKSGNHRPSAILAGKYCTHPVATLRKEAGVDGDGEFEGPLKRLRS